MCNLLHKDDWEEAKLRYKAWWAHENFGRCGLWVTAPRDDASDEPPPQRPASHEDPEVAWHDLDFKAAQNDYKHRRTFYGGEAFPVWSPGYAMHKNLNVFLGCKASFQPSTAWAEPLWTGESLEYHSIELDENNPHLQYAIREQQRAVAECADGRAFPPVVTNLSGCGDILANIRGTERLLFDVIDQPDEVRQADLALMAVQLKVYDRFYEMTRGEVEGSTTWFRLWSPGKFYPTQNDFAYMLSPQQFRDVFLPTIEKQLDHVDYSVHHLDGVGNFNHIDALLELPKMRAIQVLPGAGQPNALHYMDLCKKIQAAGRNLHIDLPPEEIKHALDELSARGLFISTSCKTETEARELLKSAEKWSHDRS